MDPRRLPLLVPSALLAGAGALAQPAADPPVARGGLELTTIVEELTTGLGQDGAAEQRLGSFTGTPGATVVYTVRFENIGGRALENVRITTPIPTELAYAADSAAGPGSRALFSADGGRSFATPAELGVGVDAYTHVRWLVPAPLDPGARGFVRFRATVKAPPASPEAAPSDAAPPP